MDICMRDRLNAFDARIYKRSKIHGILLRPNDLLCFCDYTACDRVTGIARRL